MADLKERNIALVSKDSDGVTTIDYPLTSTEMVEGIEEFVKKFAQLGTTLAAYGITDAKIENGVITLGNKTITPITAHQSLANVAKTNQDNSFSGTQSFDVLKGKKELMPFELNTPTPTNHLGIIAATAAVTINLATIFGQLAASTACVYTAFISATASQTLEITGQDTIYYVGSASDCAIAKKGVLLNVLCYKTASSSKVAVVSVSACG